MTRHLLCAGLLTAMPCFAPAQQPQPKPMGTISTADAKLSGGLEVSANRARLLTNVAITAFDHSARIELDRGGELLVCATSDFHLLHSGPADSLLFALDRGAMELRSPSRPQDAIVTPDLRFTVLTSGPLDLRLRVTREGDTCVENRGASAPILHIVEGFGDAQYHLGPNQHVLFEHGSLRQVVDNERSNCGCPAAVPAMVATSSLNATSVVSPEQAAAQNPFPADQSAGLSATPPVIAITDAMPATATLRATTPSAEPPPPTPPAPPQAIPVVAATPAPPQTKPTPVASAAPPPSPPGVHDLASAIGTFFRRLFHRKPK